SYSSRSRDQQVATHGSAHSLLLRSCRATRPGRGRIMKRIIAMLTVAFVLAGCTAQYQVRSLSGTHNSVNLSKQEGVYIALPPDGEYGATKYTGSGQTVAQVLAVAFSRYATSVHTAQATAPQKLAIAAATKSGDRYVVMPLITHWEPRNTAWSGKRS